MAARRAAAKAAAAAAEKEPEKKEEKKSSTDIKGEERVEGSADNRRSITFEDGKRRDDDERREPGTRERVIEKITERIILCPSGQNPCTPSPGPCSPYPAQRYCNCPPEIESTRRSFEQPKKKKGKKQKSGAVMELGEDGLCLHPYCVLQREKLLTQPLCPGVPQAPSHCCCPCSDCPESDSSDSEEDDPCSSNSATQVTFMNMVFAAANVMNERANVFCNL